MHKVAQGKCRWRCQFAILHIIQIHFLPTNGTRFASLIFVEQSLSVKQHSWFPFDVLESDERDRQKRWHDFVHSIMWTRCESIPRRDHFVVDRPEGQSDRISFDQDFSSCGKNDGKWNQWWNVSKSIVFDRGRGGNDQKRIEERTDSIEPDQWNQLNLTDWFDGRRICLQRSTHSIYRNKHKSRTFHQLTIHQDEQLPSVCLPPSPSSRSAPNEAKSRFSCISRKIVASSLMPSIGSFEHFRWSRSKKEWRKRLPRQSLTKSLLSILRKGISVRFFQLFTKKFFQHSISWIFFFSTMIVRSLFLTYSFTTSIPHHLSNFRVESRFLGLMMKTWWKNNILILLDWSSMFYRNYHSNGLNRGNDRR